MMKSRRVVALLACLLLPGSRPAVTAQQALNEAARVERLVSLAKLWGAIKYFHPYLAYREDIDWDRALVEAIPKVNAAKSPDDYAGAVEGMLQALGDPATRIIHKQASTPPPAAAADPSLDPSFKSMPDGLLLVSMVHYGNEVNFTGIRDRTAALSKEIAKAKAVIFDLRPPTRLAENEQGGVTTSFNYGRLGNHLSSTPVLAPGERRRMHVGFVPQQGRSSGEYESAFYISLSAEIAPDAGARDLPLVFLVNEYSEVPSVVLGLQTAGKAAIVAEGGVNDSSAVSTQRFKLAEGVEAEIRLGELIYADGSTGLQPDVIVPPSPVSGEQNPAFQAALALARNFKVSAATRKRAPAAGAVLPDKPYAEMSYPAPEYRVLAAFRIWNVIDYFFPYKDLMGEDWDGVLREFIPRMEKAGNALEYNLAVAEMVTRFHDGHGFVFSPALREFFGVAPSPVRLRMIEGVPVVTGFLNGQAAKDAKEAGAEIGDVILKVDGEDVRDRLPRLAKYISSSTSQWRTHRAARDLLNGPDGSTAMVTVRDLQDQLKELKLPRKSAYSQGVITERTGDPYRLLPGNIGYADLDRLEVSMVDEMFEKFKNTKAIIFDDRTYPHGTAWAIAPRLSEKDYVVAAMFTRRVPMFPDAPLGERTSQATSQTFYQQIPRTDKWRYKGKTVMLIDERAASQAEHTGLFLEAAGGTKFVGSPTAGVNGDVTNFCVPGGIWINFTGQAVRHADGRQLQRVGLKPDVEVRPTIRGIRAGKDEVLEKAIEYLQRELR
jgi:C-terminal processing protease CtpA/Prc